MVVSHFSQAISCTAQLELVVDGIVPNNVHYILIKNLEWALCCSEVKASECRCERAFALRDEGEAKHFVDVTSRKAFTMWTWLHRDIGKPDEAAMEFVNIDNRPCIG